MNSKGEIAIANGDGDYFLIGTSLFTHLKPLKLNNNQIWIESKTGEGMAVDQKKLFDCINEFFKKEF